MKDACVLDTMIASFLLDQHPLLASYQPYLENKSPVLSFQTVAEMRYGALKSGWGQRRQNLLERFLMTFPIVFYSDELGMHCAELMNEAKRSGRRLECADAWIAATARHLSIPLITHDQDFSPEACPSITILRVPEQP